MVFICGAREISDCVGLGVTGIHQYHRCHTLNGTDLVRIIFLIKELFFGELNFFFLQFCKKIDSGGNADFILHNLCRNASLSFHVKSENSCIPYQRLSL